MTTAKAGATNNENILPGVCMKVPEFISPAILGRGVVTRKAPGDDHAMDQNQRVITLEELRGTMPISSQMPFHLLASVWPVLAVLAYLLVTVVLYILARYRQQYISLHDRIRESHDLRNAYVQSLKDRGGNQ